MSTPSLFTLAATTAVLSLVASAPSFAQSRFEALANSPMSENRPTPETAKTLSEELLFQRATQTYLWAMPLINTMGMKDGLEKKFGSGYNILTVWETRFNSRSLVTTPNSDVIYAMAFLDLAKDGPMVFDAPPMLQGILMDAWQHPIPGPEGFAGDVGLPGPDGGKGGKFLILPPGYKGEVPHGYFVYHCSTNTVFVFLRSFFKDPKDLSPAVKLMESAKIYPLNAKSPKPMKYPNGSAIVANMLPASDATAFDQLKYLVDAEGSNLADPDWLGMLAMLGIIKGQPFNPDAATRAILNDAAKTGYKMSRVIGFQSKVGGRDFHVYPDRHWLNPMADGTPEKPAGPFDLGWRRIDPGYTDLNTRTWFFTDYYSLSPGMISQIPGKGAKYMIAFNDSTDTPLFGDKSYQITLPPNIPAALFWSLTLYEAENASGLANGKPLPSLGSLDKPTKNPDGSTTLYLGPKAPAGKEGNWLPTPSRGYFAILRLYAPTEAAIDKSWKPGDIEPVK